MPKFNPLAFVFFAREGRGRGIELRRGGRKRGETREGRREERERAREVKRVRARDGASGITRSEKSSPRRDRESNPRSAALEADALTTRPTKGSP